MQWTNSKNRVLKIKKMQVESIFPGIVPFCMRTFEFQSKLFSRIIARSWSPPPLYKPACICFFPQKPKMMKLQAGEALPSGSRSSNENHIPFQRPSLAMGVLWGKNGSRQLLPPRGYQLLNVGWGPLSCTDCWGFLSTFFGNFFCYFSAQGWGRDGVGTLS